MWRVLQNGQSLGQRGPDGGIIVSDEQYESSARITLERQGRSALWSITCEIRGCFTHTAHAASEQDARRKYADMQRDLASIMAESPSTPCYEKLRLFTDVY